MRDSRYKQAHSVKWSKRQARGGAISRERRNTNIRKDQAEQIDGLDIPLDFTNRIAWLLDIGLKKFKNPDTVTIEDVQATVKQWNSDERMAVFLLVAKYIAADLIAQAEYEEGQLALKCLKSATSGKKISCSEVIKLASALDVGTEELSQVLQKLSIKETNGTT